MKTSISLDEEIMHRLEEYRSQQRPIPNLSKAIIDLLNKALDQI